MSSNKEDYINWQLSPDDDGDEEDEDYSKEIHKQASKYAEVIVPAVLLGIQEEIPDYELRLMKAIFRAGYAIASYPTEEQEQLVVDYLAQELGRAN